jgi:hypothetical protein
VTPAERIEELEAEVAYLKSEMGLSREASDLAAVRDGLRIPRQQAQILLVLFRAYPRILTRFQVWDAIDHPYSGDDVYATNSINVRVSGIRKNLGQGIIHVSKGVGLGLTDMGAAKIGGCLKPSTDSSPGDYPVDNRGGPRQAYDVSKNSEAA